MRFDGLLDKPNELMRRPAFALGAVLAVLQWQQQGSRSKFTRGGGSRGSRLSRNAWANDKTNMT